MSTEKNKRHRVTDPFEQGDKLRDLRNKRKWTIEHAADKLRTSPTSLSEYELGNRLPPREFLEQAALLYEVDLSLFYSTDKLTFHINNHDHATGHGYVREAPSVDRVLFEQMLAHMAERDKRVETLFARLIDKLGGQDSGPLS